MVAWFETSKLCDLARYGYGGFAEPKSVSRRSFTVDAMVSLRQNNE